MDIIKKFQTNSLGLNIEILNDSEYPLYKASDVGTVLGISNISEIIKSFSSKEKIVIQVDISESTVNVDFLTSYGLYRILFISEDPISKEFRMKMFDKIYYELNNPRKKMYKRRVYYDQNCVILNEISWSVNDDVDKVEYNDHNYRFKFTKPAPEYYTKKYYIRSIYFPLNYDDYIKVNYDKNITEEQIIKKISIFYKNNENEISFFEGLLAINKEGDYQLLWGT